MATSVNYTYGSRDWEVSSGDKPTWLRAKVISGTATAQNDRWVFDVTAGFEGDYRLEFTSKDEANWRVYMRLSIKEGDTVLASNTQVLIGEYYADSTASGPTISLQATSLTSNATTVSVTLDFDFYTDFLGSNGAKGLYWQSKGTNIYHLYEYGSFSVGDLYQKPSFNEFKITDRTTKSITFYSSWNDIQNKGGAYKDADTFINLYDASGNELADGNGNKQLRITGSSGDPSGYATFDNLIDNTNYRVKAYIDDGTTTIWYNDGDFIDTSTKKLALIKEYITPHQFSIESKWKCQIDDQDSTTGISFNNYYCKDQSGNNRGETKYSNDNSPNKIVTTSGLESYTEYDILYSITDGFNVKVIEETVRTTFPYGRAYANGAWHKTMPYIYTNGRWHLAKGYIYIIGSEGQDVDYNESTNVCYTKYQYEGYDDTSYVTYFFIDSEDKINVDHQKSIDIVTKVNNTASSNDKPQCIVRVYDADDYLVFEYNYTKNYSQKYYTIFNTSDGNSYYQIENALQQSETDGVVNSSSYVKFDPEINKICFYSNVDTEDYTFDIQYTGLSNDKSEFKEFNGE